MKIRFQADADLNQIFVLATVRREPTIDFQTAGAAGLAARNDQEVLEVAARDGRLLVTHDQKTMPRHFAEFIARTTSPGLLVIPQHLSVATVVEDLRLIWLITEAEEWNNRVSFLPL
jgi:predicted nuclease of predicted toxin-antitoxin system